MDTADIIAAAERIADDLVRIAALLDSNRFRLSHAADRAIRSRLSQVCCDTANGIRQRRA